MLNRDLVIVRLKQPFVDWINEADPYPDGSSMTLEEVNRDVSTFLVHDHASEDLDGWLKECYSDLFEAILEEWYVDETLWPRDRTLARRRDRAGSRGLRLAMSPQLTDRRVGPIMREACACRMSGP